MPKQLKLAIEIGARFTRAEIPPVLSNLQQQLFACLDAELPEMSLAAREKLPSLTPEQIPVEVLGAIPEDFATLGELQYWLPRLQYYLDTRGQPGSTTVGKQFQDLAELGILLLAFGVLRDTLWSLQFFYEGLQKKLQGRELLDYATQKFCHYVRELQFQP